MIGSRSSRGKFIRKPMLRLAPTEHPTTVDIAWAAGVFEGEGHPYKHGLTVTQKDQWLLFRLQALFGGHITKARSQYSECFKWQLSGSRGRGFLMTMFSFLSPRRKQQILDCGVLG